MPRKIQRLHLATLNVRYDTHASLPVPIPPNGHVPPHGHPPWTDAWPENPWSERRSRLVDTLLSTGQLDIIGFQEVLHNQLLDLQVLLAGYDSVGVGRDDGHTKGEYSPVFWDADLFDVVRWKTVWLSPTPDVPGSVGWDASQTRIATLVTLSDAHGRLYHVVNTHYDDAGVRARAESSLIIREQVKKWVEGFERGGKVQRGSVVLMGDFNSPESEEGHQNITSPSPLPSDHPSFTFLDAFKILRLRSPHSLKGIWGLPGGQSGPAGPVHTYTGFTRPGRTTTSRIDFVMLAAEHEPGHTAPVGSLPPSATSASSADAEQPGGAVRGGWEVVRYGVVDNWIEEGDASGWQGRWSDHRAVRVVIEREV